MSCAEIINIVLSVLSFILAALSLVFIWITLRQNKKLLNSNEVQINEMRREHQLSVQPIVVLDDESFLIERPRFFYTPPEDEYSFQSIYHFNADIRNVSCAPAIHADITAELIVPKEKGEYALQTISRSYNIIACDGGAKKLNIRISGDSSALLYEALRESATAMLPKIRLEVIYQNTTGGYFMSKQLYLLIPHDEDLNYIREWHTCISSAPVDAKEAIDAMKSSQHESNWDKVFNLSKDIFELRLGNPELKNICIECREVPEKYEFCTLSKDDYEKIIQKHGYGHYVHKTANCQNS